MKRLVPIEGVTQETQQKVAVPSEANCKNRNAQIIDRKNPQDALDEEIPVADRTRPLQLAQKNPGNQKSAQHKEQVNAEISDAERLPDFPDRHGDGRARDVRKVRPDNE
jgi:hypothetical protein